MAPAPHVVLRSRLNEAIKEYNNAARNHNAALGTNSSRKHNAMTTQRNRASRARNNLTRIKVNIEKLLSITGQAFYAAKPGPKKERLLQIIGSLQNNSNRYKILKLG
jgi:hypothetical protein